MSLFRLVLWAICGHTLGRLMDFLLDRLDPPRRYPGRAVERRP